MSLTQPVLPVAALRRVAALGAAHRTGADLASDSHGPCALCGMPLGAGAHAHAADTVARTLGCLCSPCQLVLPPHDAQRYGDQPASRWRRIPEEAWWDLLPSPVVDALDLPVGLAFLLRRGRVDGSSGEPGVLVGYPGAAGVVESALAADSWHDLCASAPLVASVRPDVEALLLHQQDDPDAPVLALRVGVDRVYALAGEVRRAARDGPAAISRAVTAHLAALQQRGQRWGSA